MTRADARESASLIFAIVFPTTAAWLYFVTFADAPFMTAVYTACKIVQFSFPIAWIALARRGGDGRGGGPAPAGPAGSVIPARRMLPAGLLSGLAAVALMWGAYSLLIEGSDLAREATPRIAARIVAIGAAGPVRYLAMTLLLSIAHSFLEEYYWRWFVFGRLRRLRGDAFAGIVSSIAFAGHHVIVLHAFIGPGRWWWMTAVLSLAVAAAGGVWAWLYARSGSLLSPWISHTMVDLGIFAIGYRLAGG